MSWNNFCASFPFSLICVIIISQGIYTKYTSALLLASIWGDFGQVRLLAKRSSNLSATESESCPSQMCTGYQSLKTTGQQPSNPFSERESLFVCFFKLFALFVFIFFGFILLLMNVPHNHQNQRVATVHSQIDFLFQVIPPSVDLFHSQYLPQRIP